METIEKKKLNFSLFCKWQSCQPGNLSVIFTQAQEKQRSKKKTVIFILCFFFHKHVFKDKPKSSYFTITISGLGFVWVAFSHSEAA